PAPEKGKDFHALAFSPDGKLLLTAPSGIAQAEKCPIAIWDVETGKAVGSLEGHTGPVWQGSFSPDGQELVSAGHDAKVHVWDLAKRAEVRASPAPLGQWVRSVVVSSTGTLAVGTTNKVHLLGASGKLLATIDRSACPLAFSPDGRLLAGTT